MIFSKQPAINLKRISRSLAQHNKFQNIFSTAFAKSSFIYHPVVYHIIILTSNSSSSSSSLTSIELADELLLVRSIEEKKSRKIILNSIKSIT
ncbi:hypothetical protein DERP_002540 [Dermatophagoides pteronyssinus]|uniref:Uncharacterized protein n=1 Tax=Dermatophagoides pteronyssinus TaxID=6956 RepID=A0ABQ8JI06_DERPT|nr:hypothetical protein DERP_002540 [Dermatophagoides pteronyssinus]